jgi:hypothetical protein
MSIKVKENANLITIIQKTRESIKTFSQSTERIASGIRFESVADDPGAIGQVTFSENAIRGITQEIKTLNEKITVAQQTDVYLLEFESILGKLKTLANQSVSTDFSDIDRLYLNREAQYLIQAMDNLIDQANTQGIAINGSEPPIDSTQATLPVIPSIDLSTNHLGTTAHYESLRRGLFVSELNDSSLVINQIDIRATTSDDDTFSTTFNSGSAIAKANAINTATYLTDVTAEVEDTTIAGNRQISSISLTGLNYFSINQEIFTGFSLEDRDVTRTLQDAINTETDYTGVTASANLDGQLVLTADDGRNIQIRYSNQDVLNAIGITDKSGDVPNLNGDVALATTDRDLKGEVQLPIDTSFQTYAGNVRVGGRFDASEDYIDFVAHVVSAGRLGVAQIRVDRDPASEVNATEDFDFIQGTVNPNVDMTLVTGDYRTLNGVQAITVGGTYNEGLDRKYIIEVTQGGSTDGVNRAQVQVSTAEDGILIKKLELDAAGGPQNIATATTGEFITIDVDPSVRTENITESIDPDQSYTKTLGNGVNINSVYTGDESKSFDITVVEEGYTQGSNAAQINITETNTFSGLTTSLGTFAVSGGVPITIGDGLSITFDSENTTFGILNEVDTNPADSYAGSVTINSNESDFIGERGDGTYAVEITSAGPTDSAQAQYRVLFNDNEIVGNRTLNSGEVELADRLTFNFEASKSVISATTVVTSVGDYADFANVTIGGDYDGSLNDIDVRVKVKEQGRVLQAGETETADGAILEFSVDGGANYQGDILAIAGQDLSLSNGLTINFASSSASSILVDNAGATLANTYTFASQSIVNDYKGEIEIDFDPSLLELDADATINIQTTGVTIGTGVAGSGDIDIVISSGGSDSTYTLSNVQSGVSQPVINGLAITFTNDSSDVVLTSINESGGNDGANISTTSSTYNGVIGNATLIASHTGDTTSSIAHSGGGVSGTTVSVDDLYNGSLGDQRYKIVFEGSTQTNPILSNLGANNVDDRATITLRGIYSGSDQDKSIKVTYDAPTATVVTDVPGNGAFNVTVDPASTYSRLNGDLDIGIDFEASTSSSQVNQIDTASGALSTSTFTINGTYDWNSGDEDLSFDFGAGTNTIDIIIGGITVSNLAISNGDVIDLGSIDAKFTGVSATYTAGNIADNENDRYDFEFRQRQTVTVTNRDTGNFVNNIEYSGGSINLNDASFDPILGANNPNISLNITNATDKDSSEFSVELRANSTVSISNTDGSNAVTGVEISSGSVDLDNTTFVGVGKLFTNNSNITLEFNDPLAGIDDSYTFDLNTASTVTVVDITNGDAIVGSGIDVSSNTLALNNATIGVDTGSTISFTNTNLAIDDEFTVDLTKDQTVELVLNGTSQGVFDASSGSIDLNASLGINLGFNLNVNTPINGQNDEFTFTLTRDHGIDNTAGNIALLGIEQKVVNQADEFQADVFAGTLEAGTRYELDVQAPTLEVGTRYNITEQVGTFQTGDIFTASVTHDFDQEPQVLNANTDLLNGLTLDFDQDGQFEIGDEIRFQVRGYTGNPTASGTYTYAISPTIFTLEVTQTGDVNGGAQFQYTRADTGETVGGLLASTAATDLDDGVQVAFDAGRVYAGDLFYIETFESLNQVFGGSITLRSNDQIEVNYEDQNTDNLLGRINYQGSIEDVDDPGTTDNTTTQFLNKNEDRAINQFNVSTQNSAVVAVELATDAIKSLSAYRSRLSNIRSLIEQVVTHYNDRKELREEQLAQFSVTEANIEAPQFINSIRSIDSGNLLTPIAQQAHNQSLLSLVQSSFTDVEFFNTVKEKEGQSEPAFKIPKPKPTLQTIQQSKKESNELNYLKVKDKPKSLLEILKEKREQKENIQVAKKENLKENSENFFDKIKDDFLDKNLTSSGQREAFRQFINDVSQKQENTLDRLRRLNKNSKNNS